jgi:hypothetical protein
LKTRDSSHRMHGSSYVSKSNSPTNGAPCMHAYVRAKKASSYPDDDRILEFSFIGPLSWVPQPRRATRRPVADGRPAGRKAISGRRTRRSCQLCITAWLDVHAPGLAYHSLFHFISASSLQKQNLRWLFTKMIHTYPAIIFPQRSLALHLGHAYYIRTRPITWRGSSSSAFSRHYSSTDVCEACWEQINDSALLFVLSESLLARVINS